MLKGCGGGQGARGRHALRTNNSFGRVEIAAKGERTPRSRGRTTLRPRRTPRLLALYVQWLGYTNFVPSPNHSAGRCCTRLSFVLFLSVIFPPLCSPRGLNVETIDTRASSQREQPHPRLSVPALRIGICAG